MTQEIWGQGDIISIKIKIFLRRQQRIVTLKLLSAIRNLFLAKSKDVQHGWHIDILSLLVHREDID